MPDSLVKGSIREVTPLSVEDSVGTAVQRLLELELPALPAVEGNGTFAGIFGEREFMVALFPGYVGTLASARIISPSIDASIDRRSACRNDPVRKYMTTDHVVVNDDFSDTLLAELFIHHRVLIIPIATGGRVHGLVTRSDFFRSLGERFLEQS